MSRIGPVVGDGRVPGADPRMITTSSTDPDQLTPAPPMLGPRRRRPGLRLVAVVAVVVIVGVAVSVAVIGWHHGGSSPSGALDDQATTSLAKVQRRSLSSQTQLDGTLGYAGDFDVVNQASGTVTALPPVGQVVHQGDVLYRVGHAPVILLYGSVPAYRDLEAGDEGPDVQQLNAALVALGDASADDLDPASGAFTGQTRDALKELQDALGVDETGKLALGAAVFLPEALRVTAVAATLGAATQPDSIVMTGTSTTPIVSVALDAARQSELKAGDAVSIQLPNGTTTAGTLSAIGTVATSAATDEQGDGSGDGAATVEVTIALSEPAAVAGLDLAPVLVNVTTASVEDALVVPVTALLALAGGGFAVETVDPAGLHRLVPVTLGLFDSAGGVVQVDGEGLQVDQQVVVPAS